MFDRLKLAMTRGGVEVHDHDIDADLRQRGSLEGGNVTARWRYDPKEETLEITVTHRPFFLPEPQIAFAIGTELRTIHQALDAEAQRAAAPEPQPLEPAAPAEETEALPVEEAELPAST